MKTLPLVALFAVLALSFPQGEAGGQSVSAFLERIKKSTVKLRDGRPESGGSIHCTGFVIDAAKGHAMTVEHCVRGGVALLVDGEPSKVIKKSQWLALIEVKPFVKPPLKFTKGRSLPGTPTWGVGWAFGNMLLPIPRTAIDYHETGLIVNGPYVGGMSGGPVVDSRGEVVGIIQAGNEALGLLSGIDEIREFLKEVK